MVQIDQVHDLGERDRLGRGRQSRDPYLRAWQRRWRGRNRYGSGYVVCAGVVQVPATRSAALPVTCSAAHDQRGLLGLLRWVSGGGKPRHLCPGPHLSLYIALCDRGPPTSGRLSVPDQDAVKGSDWPLGQLVEIKLTPTTFLFLGQNLHKQKPDFV